MRRSPLLLGAAFLAMALGTAACSAASGGASSTQEGTAVAGGTVTVKAGNKVVCVMTINAGKGSCKVNTAKYAPGTLKFVATYSGGGGKYKTSSGSANLKLLRAASKTSLTRSAATVTYGHEQAERISVRVTPQYAGTPPGTVTVKAGAAVVCVIALAAGAGSCTLPAAKLAAGSYQLTASYAGSAAFAASTSAKLALTVAG
jgi:hypothetical protein